MHDMTATHLRSAFGGESMAHMRYGVWADTAREEGFPNVARLFQAVAYAEQVHGSNHFRELRNEAGDFAVTSMAPFRVGSTAENLQGGIDGETFEIEEMYPVYLQTAEFQDESGARRVFHYALEAEKIHAALYRKAKQAVDGGSDLDLDTVQICDNCGYTAEGEAPETCPICNVGKDRFKAFA
jgi:rubrerythrin